MVAFGPDGKLYVVDWGEIEIAPERGGVRMKQESGVLWRIRRVGAAHGQEPPLPAIVPLYPLQLATLLAGAVGLIGAIIWLSRRWLRGR